MRGIAQQPLEIEGRGVVEGEARSLAELRGEVLQLALEFAVRLEHRLLGRLQHAVDPPQDGEGEDHVGVLAAPEGVPKRSATPQMKVTFSPKL